MAPTRILALCGFTQNATIYSKQLGAVRKTAKNAEFVFLEPPIVVQKADMPWNAGSLDQFASNATTEEESQTPETTPRAWWLSSGDTADKKVFRGYNESIKYIHDFMVSNGPFDGIMGFSQGACMAAVVAALLEKPGLHPDWTPSPALPKLKFLIAVGGFLPAAVEPSFDNYFPLPATLPVLHVLGKNDVVVSAERSQSLIDGSLNSRVEQHDGGHFTPSKASWRHFFNAYITAVANGEDQNDVPPVNSFGPSGANTPATGSGTPRSSTPAPAELARP
ncbi:Esterase OVCA2 [Vanrija pseudolonga]|uniref:Esterase OVCA2 n=1 Tax=Vanrija pseudolonga TaxID=143232 RepID=A0AAF1BK62_9TREE|nr:Esterase OVCA2 [Vanrija pseudolonga]